MTTYVMEVDGLPVFYCERVGMEREDFSLYRSQLSKVGVGDVADGGFDVEVILGLEAECAGDNAAREHLAFVAVVSNVAVIETPCRLNPVFGIDQLSLEFQEILVGL